MDRAAALAIAVVMLPPMALIALAILLCDGRPVFYRQSRVGKDGRQFRIWKFRTMRRDAERQTGPIWSCATDERVTPLGRWLRLSHADELPQIFNVLSGDMSLIGPRPERPEFVRELALELPNYTQRLQVRPGITGLAQLVLGYDRTVADVRRKVELDLQYIRTATFGRDVALLVRTIPCILDQLICHVRDNRRRSTAVSQSTEGTNAVLQSQRAQAPPDGASRRAARVVPRRRTA